MLRGTGLISGVTRLAFQGDATEVGPRLARRACRVDGRLFHYGEVVGHDEEGEVGPTVLLVHGWGLGHSSYTRAAQHLALRGFRVLLPDLPGFGRSADLPFTKVNFEAFALSLRGFLECIHERSDGGSTPVHVVGHSFGGAVSARLAHDAPELVASLVLVDAATGATWRRDEKRERLLSERPLWDWAFNLVHEFPFGGFPTAATTVLRDLSHNLVWHLPNLGMVAHITRLSDIRQELARVSDLGIPVSVVWAAGDRVVTKACFDDQCLAVKSAGTIVDGNHGWPFANPASFGRVIAELLPRTTS